MSLGYRNKYNIRTHNWAKIMKYSKNPQLRKKKNHCFLPHIIHDQFSKSFLLSMIKSNYSAKKCASHFGITYKTRIFSLIRSGWSAHTVPLGCHITIWGTTTNKNILEFTTMAYTLQVIHSTSSNTFNWITY